MSNYPEPAMGCFARIEKLENGYEIEVNDPKIVAANNKPNARWRDPCKEYAFKDLKSAVKWLIDNEAMIAADGSDDSTTFTSAWNEAKTKE